MTKEVKFIEERGNPYESTTNPKLHNFTSGQVVSEESTAKLLKYFEHGQEQYEKFRNERFVTRTKKLSDTLTKVILPKFEEKKQKPKTNQQLVKSTAKRIGEAQKQLEIARERGISIGEILSYDHLNENILFVEDLTAKPNKSELVKELEQILEPFDYNFEIQSHYSTPIMLDFMSQVRKYPTKKLGNFNELFAATSSGIMNIPEIEQIDIIYDSYLEDSIKECERIRRESECEPLEFVNLTMQSSIPVQMDRFWACGKNKENLELLPRQYFKTACKEKNLHIILSGMSLMRQVCNHALMLMEIDSPQDLILTQS